MLLSCALIPQGSAAAKYKKLQPCSSFRADEIRACSGKSAPHTLVRARCLYNPTNKVRVEWLQNIIDSSEKTSQRALLVAPSWHWLYKQRLQQTTGITIGSDLESEEKTGLNELGQNLGHR